MLKQAMKEATYRRACS